MDTVTEFYAANFGPRISFTSSNLCCVRMSQLRVALPPKFVYMSENVCQNCKGRKVYQNGRLLNFVKCVNKYACHKYEVDASKGLLTHTSK